MSAPQVANAATAHHSSKPHAAAKARAPQFRPHAKPAAHPAAAPIGATPQVSAAAVGATFTVNSSADTADATPGDGLCVDSAGKCTLRAALDEANADPGTTVINVPAGTDIKLDSGLGALTVTHSVIINGGGATTVIDGQNATLDFNIGDSTINPSVAINNLTVENGSNGSNNGGDIYSEYAGVTLTNVLVKGGSALRGGGVYSGYYGTLWLANTTVDSSTASSEGGGLFLDGSAYSNGSTISNNTAGTGTGGGVYIDSGQVTLDNTTVTANTASDGAGIYNDETLQMSGGSIDHNKAQGSSDVSGAAIDGENSTTLSGVAVTDNTASSTGYVEGGVIYNGSAMALTNTTISGSSITGGYDQDLYGGVVSNDGENFTMNGGSITGTTVTMTDGTNNGGYLYGGVVYGDETTSLTGVTISNSTINDSGSGYEADGGVFYADNSSPLTLTWSAVSNTTVTADTIYGGVAYLDANSTLSGNTVKSTTDNFGSYLEGGVLYNNYYLNLADLTVDGTTASSPLASDGGVYGGVISNDGDSSTLQSVSVTNTQVTDAGSGSYVEGGVLYNDYPLTVDHFQAIGTKVTTDDEVYGGVLSNDGDHTSITNSTFGRATVDVTGANSAADNYLYGGAAYLEYGTNLVNDTFANVASTAPATPGYDVSTIDLDDNINFTNVTVANNTVTGPTDATLVHSGIWYDTSGYIASFKNTIVSNTPVAHECGVDSSGVASQLSSTGNNLENGTSCGFTNQGDQQNTDPKVAALADNGGPVQTAALLTGSPAINTGTNNGCPATDARGVNRPVLGTCDIGAYEWNLEGYWFAASDGGVFAFGPGAHFYGSTGGVKLASPIVGMASDPATGGYWLVAADGGVFAFHAPFFGSMGGKHLNQPIVGISSAPGGTGYRLVAKDGGIFSFGKGAPFYGSTGNLKLVSPIVGMATDQVTGGYWLVAADGGMFAFHAPFYGSMGGHKLAQPVVGMAPAPFGGGYWLVAKDGGIFAFGKSAHFYGSTGGIKLAQPIVSISADDVTGGYWMVAADGGVFAFHAPFYGSTGGVKLVKPIVASASAS